MGALGQLLGLAGTYDTTNWLTEKQRLLEDFFPIRSRILLAQLRNVQPQLYPDLDAPLFTPAGGAIKKNETVSLSVPGGATVYYTLDGQDPRLVGGAVTPMALTYASPFTLPGPTTTVKARAFDGNEWSALEVQGFAVGVKIRINEILAENDSGALDEAGENEDWIEIINTGFAPVNLRGWGLSDDPNDPGKWRFPNGTVLVGGGRLIVYCDKDPLDGPLHANFRIQNGGETILLSGGLLDGDVLVDQTSFRRLGPDTAWARIPDGTGHFQGTGKPTPLAKNQLGDRMWQ